MLLDFNKEDKKIPNYDILRNVATISGDYDGASISLTTGDGQVRLLNELTATKVADKTIWASGVLTYTITVTNVSDTDFTDVTLTDLLDPTLVALVDNSVNIDGVANTTYTYDDTTGSISIPLGTVPQAGDIEVTFQVEKAA